MSTFEKISPDDPRLTTYALGEMEPAERAEFEQHLAQDADARALVAEINGTAQHIGVALAGEALPVGGPQISAPALGQAAIIPGRDRRKYDGGPLHADEGKNGRSGWGQLLRFPNLYFTISGVAAACFALGFIIWQAGYVAPKQVQYTEVDLSMIAPAEPAEGKNMADGEVEFEVGLLSASAGNVEAVVSLKSDEKDNEFFAVERAPVSTFPIKVGKAAYANVRRFIQGGHRPPAAAVKIEELVNFFRYAYVAPSAKELPFMATMEVASAPWKEEHRLVRIGLKGREAQKLDIPQGGSTLVMIAKAVEIQVEFNPAQVQAYRLIGYENRMLQKEGFNNDKIDAGEIGAGHTVTALYEVVPTGAEWKQEGGVDGLKYQMTESEGLKMSGSGELLTVKLRYKEPDGDVSRKLEFALRDGGGSFEQASADFKFAASVAAFGMILRESPHKGAATFASVAQWAQAGLVDDAGGYRSEFVGLIGQAERLAQN